MKAQTQHYQNATCFTLKDLHEKTVALQKVHNKVDQLNVQNEINEYAKFFEAYPEYRNETYNEFSLVLCGNLK